MDKISLTKRLNFSCSPSLSLSLSLFLYLSISGIFISHKHSPPLSLSLTQQTLRLNVLIYRPALLSRQILDKSVK